MAELSVPCEWHGALWYTYRSTTAVRLVARQSPPPVPKPSFEFDMAATSLPPGLHDVFYLILSHLAPNPAEPNSNVASSFDETPDSTSARKDLACLARAHRSFTQPTLAVLWRSLPSQKPLEHLLCAIGIAQWPRNLEPGGGLSLVCQSISSSLRSIVTTDMSGRKCARHQHRIDQAGHDFKSMPLWCERSSSTRLPTSRIYLPAGGVRCKTPSGVSCLPPCTPRPLFRAWKGRSSAVGLRRPPLSTRRCCAF